MVLEKLEPKIVWYIFEHVISSTPRPSKYEEKIRKKLKTWLIEQDKEKSLNLIIKEDGVGNIFIKKPPTKGMEDLPTLLLQAHMDMVCETDRTDGFDFFTQGIPVQIQENSEWVDAKGTTLGADDGIGMALALAILVDVESNISHGPIEVLFTVNEEDGFTGATELDVNILDIKSKFLINLDSGDLGGITIGSVGGRRVHFTKKLPWSNIENLESYRLVVSGLAGGHSGGDIHLPRANANKLISRLISSLTADFNLYISSWIGGTKSNAIPRKSIIEFAIEPEDSKMFKEIINKEISILYDYYKKESQTVKIFEPHLEINLSPLSLTKFLSANDSKNIINLVNLIPNGVLRQSFIHENFVESSTNIGIININEELIEIWIYPRSIYRSELHAFCRSMEQLGFLANWNVKFRPILAEWNPDMDSTFLKYIKSEYEKVFGNPVKMEPTHGGLETATIREKIPGLEMVAISPTVIDGHSPSEKLKIQDVKVIYDILKNILANFKSLQDS